MRKKGNKWNIRYRNVICLVVAGMLIGGGLFGAVKSSAAEEKALANKSWDSVESVIRTKLGESYNEAGMCTGFLYWCLKNAYGVDWGDNSKVWQLENKLKAAGITKVAEGKDGKVTADMKPGDIIIFIDGTQRSHCAILGEGGKLYHAVRRGVLYEHTLSGWMKMPYSEKGCDSYVVYRGLISTGNLALTKKSTNPELTDDNGCYTLSGAEYGLYKGDILQGKLKTNDNGKAFLGEIPYGEYTLKEITPSKGYAIDKKEYKIKVDRRSVAVEVEEVPQGDEVEAIIYKLDEEIHDSWNEDNRGQAGATLEGAIYSVRYYDKYFEEVSETKNMDPVRSWVISTDKSGQAVLDENSVISGDELYYSSNGNIILPLGTIVIHEMTAPEGYVLDKEEHIVQITGDGTEELVDTYEIPIHREQIIRGDIEFIKIEDSTMLRLAGVPFMITSKSTGESHIVVTDSNGYVSSASSWNLHTYNTNEGDDVSGVWFGDIRAINNGKGALPYDTYIIDEQPCQANENHDLIKGVEVKIYRNNRTVDMGTITNDIVSKDSLKEEIIQHEMDTKEVQIREYDESPKTGDNVSWVLSAAFNIMLISAVIACIFMIRKKI